MPDFPGKEHVITSNEAFFLDSLPERIIIVGGGYIAVTELKHHEPGCKQEQAGSTES